MKPALPFFAAYICVRFVCIYVRESARALYFLHFCKNFVRKVDTNEERGLLSYGKRSRENRCRRMENDKGE